MNYCLIWLSGKDSACLISIEHFWSTQCLKNIKDLIYILFDDRLTCCTPDTATIFVKLPLSNNIRHSWMLFPILPNGTRPFCLQASVWVYSDLMGRKSTMTKAFQTLNWPHAIEPSSRSNNGNMLGVPATHNFQPRVGLSLTSVRALFDLVMSYARGLLHNNCVSVKSKSVFHKTIENIWQQAYEFPFDLHCCVTHLLTRMSLCNFKGVGSWSQGVLCRSG